MPDPAPVPLSYGHQAPIWRRRKTIILVFLLLGLVGGGYFAWQPARNWYAHWQYQRQAMRWYNAALNWSEPSTKLKYSENPADFNAPGAGTTTLYDEDGNAVSVPMYTGTTKSKHFGGSFVERPPRFGHGGVCLTALPEQFLLFAHGRTTKAGLSRLIAIGDPYFGGRKLRLYVEQIEIFRGKPTTMRGEPEDVDMTGICGPGEIRLYAGQPDPNDPAKFSIPFEARGRKGWIDGIFTPGRSFSSDPKNAGIEQEANSRVSFSIRMAPVTTTQPASTRA
jgi:hypothetical protein